MSVRWKHKFLQRESNAEGLCSDLAGAGFFKDKKGDFDLKKLFLFVVGVFVLVEFVYLVVAAVPTHTQPILNSTFGTNLTTENLTCYNQSTSDSGGHNVTNAYTFYKNSETNKLFHLRAENNLTDLFGSSPTTEFNTSYMQGKIGTGVYMPDGAGLEYDGAGNINGTVGTISLWINAQSDIYENGLINYFFYWKLDGNNQIQIYLPSGDYMRFRYEGQGETQKINRDESDSWNAGEWHHLAMTWDGSVPIFSVYMDGQFLESGTDIEPILIGGGEISVGEYQDTDESDSIIDEFMIYDRVLSDEEINLHYNEVYNKILSNQTSIGENWTCEVTPNDGIDNGVSLLSNNLTIIPDLIPPIVNITSPFNNSQSSDPTPDISFNITDNFYTALTYQIYVDGNLVTDSGSGSTTAGIETTVSITSAMSLGNHNVTVRGIDGGNNSANYTINLSIVPPVVYLSSPAYNSVLNYSNVTFSFNVSDPTYSNLSCVLYINDVLNQTNTTTLSYNQTNFNVTGLNEGLNQNWSVNCTNPVNVSSSDTWPLGIDTIYPGIDFVFPTTASGNYTQNWIYANVSVNETNIDTITINLYNVTGLVSSQASSSSPFGYNFTSLAEGVYYLNASVNDSAGNVNLTETREIVLDTSAPDVFDLRPISNTTYNVSDTIEIGANITDYIEVNYTYANVTMPNGTITKVILSNVDGTNWYNTSYTISPVIGRYNVTFFANDTLNNINATETTFFIGVDNVNPQIQFVNLTMTEGTYTQYSIYANVTAWDNVNISTIIINLYNSTGLVQSNVSFTSPLFINFTNLPYATYYLNATVNDTSNNINSTETRIIILRESFYVDSAILNSTFGTNLTVENLTAYAINVTAEDNDSIKLIYDWKRNGSSIAVLNMPFEGGSNSTWTRDYSDRSNNGTVVNDVTWNSTGGHDGKGAYEFDAVDDYIDLGSNPDFAFGTGDFTYTAWIYPTDLSIGYSMIIGFGTSLHFQTNGDRLRFWLSASFTTSWDSLVEDTWQHVAVTRTNGVIRLYIDGVTDGSTSTQPKSIDQLTGSIGKHGSLSRYYFPGSIDEVMIFNRSLSAEQMLALYNNRTDLIVSQETVINETWQSCVTPNDGTVDGNEVCSNNLTILPDTIPPIVNITYPANNSQSSDPTPEISFNITDNAYTTLTYQIYVDDNLAAHSGSGSTTAGIETTVSITSAMSLGDHNVTVRGIDGGNNSANYTINLSIVPPVVYLSSPAYNSVLNYSNVTFSFNVSDPTYSNLSCVLYINDVLNQTNTTTLSYNQTNFNVTGLNEGLNQNWSVNCTNPVNVSSSDTWPLGIDTIYPGIDFVFPTTASGNYTQNWIYANVSVNETNIDTITINLYNVTGLVSSQASSSSPFGYNFTSLAEGVYYLNASVNDSAGNVNLTETREIVLIVDSCTCPFSAAAWSVNMADYCWLNSECDITGYLTFYGIGNFTINSTLYVNEIKNLTANMTVWMKPGGVMRMGVN